LPIHRAAVFLRHLNEEDVFFFDVMVFIRELPGETECQLEELPRRTFAGLQHFPRQFELVEELPNQTVFIS
jgi:hypothetical protein